MAASSRSRRSSGPVLRSLSPSAKFHSSSSTPSSSSSSAFASSTSTFSSRSTTFLHRSTSPTRVNLYGSPPPPPSVRFSLDRPTSPSRSISVSSLARNKAVSSPANRKRTCMCSPTSHPGSFRCSLHKNISNQTVSYPSNGLNARRSAMTNSLVRIGTVEGDLVRRALAALIRPSSHQQRRRGAFQPRPSRLSVMSKAAY
ncbi:Valine--tRNA ligase [Actinidia chinensis var. chinensis]|uniref:Valine--tRNA ligase n=1 Tax=Actinidia chinensis var. chinensis TaxID=1590841 RepID=A0A2R6QHV5_ACTCC|nr:Valine--tRNA ligase [Actinidia chinensis var. chinensis]